MEFVKVTTRELMSERIRARTPEVGIIGLGYLRLPFTVDFANAGFAVVGIDVQTSKVDELNAGRSDIQDVPADCVQRSVEAGRLRATTDFSVIAELENEHSSADAAPHV